MAVTAFTAFHMATQTVSATALTLADFGSISQAQVDRASRIRITVETQGVRYRYDGTAPTASVGHLLPATAELILTGTENVRQFRIIRSGGSDATVMVTLEE
jgi:hypothetical protein